MEKTEQEVIRILKRCEVFVGLDALKAEKPDLMILDLLMSEMDGFTMMQKLKDQRWAKYAHIPIVVLTLVGEDASPAGDTNWKPMFLMDVDDYIEKLINPPVVLERAERLLLKSK